MITVTRNPAEATQWLIGLFTRSGYDVNTAAGLANIIDFGVRCNCDDNPLQFDADYGGEARPTGPQFWFLNYGMIFGYSGGCTNRYSGGGGSQALILDDRSADQIMRSADPFNVFTNARAGRFSRFPFYTRESIDRGAVSRSPTENMVANLLYLAPGYGGLSNMLAFLQSNPGTCSVFTVRYGAAFGALEERWEPAKTRTGQVPMNNAWLQNPIDEDYEPEPATIVTSAAEAVTVITANLRDVGADLATANRIASDIVNTHAAGGASDYSGDPRINVVLEYGPTAVVAAPAPGSSFIEQVRAGGTPTYVPGEGVVVIAPEPAAPLPVTVPPMITTPTVPPVPVIPQPVTPITPTPMPQPIPQPMPQGASNLALYGLGALALLLALRR